LGVVLFPKSALPLHIFEERYKILINLAVDKGIEFGINLTENGVMARVGCTARVREVIRRYEDGKLDIVVEGGTRYALLEFHEDKAPYFVGTVERREETEETDRKVLQEAIAWYNRLMDAVYGEGSFQMRADEGGMVSFRMAQKSGLDLSSRQHLLEVDSENSRLKWLLTHFREVLPKLEHEAEVKTIIRNDGYL